MPRNPPDPKLVALVIEKHAAGATVRELAPLAGVSEPTIRTWLKRYGDAPPRTTAPTRAAPPAPDAEPREPEPPDDAPAIEHLRWQLRDMRRQAGEAQALGNTTAAQRHTTAAGKLMPILARLEREERSATDAIVIQQHELAALRKQWRDFCESVREQPLVCAECGKRLRMRAAGVES
jgi:predicted transcriptional regulator